MQLHLFVLFVIYHFNHSSLACDKLGQCQDQLGQQRKKLIQDVSTRWNSTLHMTESLVEQKNALSLYSADSNIPKLTSNQWVLLEKLIKVLKPCEQFTKDVSGDCASISLVIPGYNLLRTYLMNLTGDEGIQTFKATIIEQLDRRFHNFTLNEIYCMATYLDPRFKNRFLSDSMMASIKSTIENNRTVADQHVFINI